MAILTGQNTASFFHEPTGWAVQLGFTPHPTKEQSLAEKFEGVWPGSFWLSIDGKKPIALNKEWAESITIVDDEEQPAQQFFKIGQNGDNTHTVFRLMTRHQGNVDKLRIIDVRAQL